MQIKVQEIAHGRKHWVFSIYCYSWRKTDYRSEQSLWLWSSSYSIQTTPAEVAVGVSYSERLQDDPFEFAFFSLYFFWWGDPAGFKCLYNIQHIQIASSKTQEINNQMPHIEIPHIHTIHYIRQPKNCFLLLFLKVSINWAFHKSN